LLPNTAAGNFSQDYDTNGGIAGGVLGYNWQSGMWVYGVEGDINWSGIKGTSAIVNIGPPNLLDTYDTSLTWYGSARGRLGWAQDRWLAYLTGGLAFGELKHNYNPGLNVPNCGTVGATCSNDVTRAGWIVGAGLEYALLNNWSVKIEYNYIDLGNSSIQYTATAANRSTWNDTFSVAKIGINYLFH
jgi:outer membrane immunogenic protein